MAKPLKLVIFDCDGTLVDSQHMIYAAMHNAFEANGLSCPSRHEILSIIGLSLPVAVEQLGGGRPNFPVATLVQCYKDAFFALRQSAEHQEPLYPGAREAIEALAGRDGLVLGIATGKSQRGVRAVLDRHDLLGRFTTIKTADDAPSKPHPGMVIEAMREAGVGALDTVVVGDSVYDMEMACAAGASAIGVGWGYHDRPALRAAGAQIVIEEFSALLPAVELVWPRARVSSALQ